MKLFVKSFCGSVLWNLASEKVWHEVVNGFLSYNFWTCFQFSTVDSYPDGEDGCFRMRLMNRRPALMES